MEYREVKKDLFTVNDGYILVHCISSDAKMGAGIAVHFKKRFGLTGTERVAKDGGLPVGSAYKEGRVINLITKERYFHKPTYATLEEALKGMRTVVNDNKIKKIAMPKIGAGLDRLAWSKNREIIKEVFKDMDVDILVCIQ